jgi:hypothetical protein
MSVAASHRHRRSAPARLLLPSPHRPKRRLLRRRWREVCQRERTAGHKCPKSPQQEEPLAAKRAKKKKNELGVWHVKRWAARRRLRFVRNSHLGWRRVPVDSQRTPNQLPVPKQLTANWLAPRHLVVRPQRVALLGQRRWRRRPVEVANWRERSLFDERKQPMDLRVRQSPVAERVRPAKHRLHAALPQTQSPPWQLSPVRLTPVARHRARLSIPRESKPPS